MAKPIRLGFIGTCVLLVLGVAVPQTHAQAVQSETQADTQQPSSPPPPAPSTAAGDFYVGGQLGFLGGSAAWSLLQPNRGSSASVHLFHSYDTVDGSGSHFAGLTAGYSHGLSSGVVLGGEVDLSFGAEPVPTGEAFSETAELFGSARGRIGRRRGGWLGYGTLGFAWTRNLIAVTTNGSGPGAPSYLASAYANRIGWTVGAGVERALPGGWSARAEYLYARFGSADVALSPTTLIASSVSAHEARVGLTYTVARTGSPDGSAKAGSANDGSAEPTLVGVVPLDIHGWSVRGQTTYLSQYASPFHAPYRGPNSLDSNAGKETWDVTFYLGRRLWNGATVWINPEIDQGFGLTNTLGVAGFPSGEAYKVGYSNPYARIPRAFVQQTIDLAGPTETVDAGVNLFAGSRATNRVVITIGKFSVSDLFDTITWAHDPRNDFMNWALVDAGTFDYAADAWGFTYGAAVEWYQGNWTARAGFFDLSTIPNSVELDPTFGEYQLDYELEHRHSLAGQPGKLSIVGYLSRGRMGSYDEALAFAAQSGTTPNTADVRRYQSRPGINLNIEQQVADGIHLFGRAGWADGSVEPYEFTDIDRTISAGVSLDGERWGRRRDTFGLATVISGISDPHTAYLAAGGLGILVGDGQLPHPGWESIIETYYRTVIGAWQVTADYQFVVNPAFNRDRGPVSVVAVRVRSQF